MTKKSSAKPRSPPSEDPIVRRGKGNPDDLRTDTGRSKKGSIRHRYRMLPRPTSRDYHLHEFEKVAIRTSRAG